MPGPKMGPRPADFDEDIVRHSPTFLKWLTLEDGERLRYACREFVRGHGDDEERLMRRIMIARRNNLRDHETLKKARAATTQDDDAVAMGFAPTVAAADAPLQQQEDDHPFERKSKRRKQASAAVDDQLVKEMDVAAVEATRSYRSWLAIEEGKEFVYNQKYIKGKPTHDWLLRKNIWRRMRYRRENKRMVQALVGVDGDDADGTISDGGTVTKNEMTAADQADNDAANSVAAGIVDDALLASAAAAADTDKAQNIHKSVVDAAVAAAESYVKSVDENTLKGTSIETV
jgi:hypothetical protein